MERETDRGQEGTQALAGTDALRRVVQDRLPFKDVGHLEKAVEDVRQALEYYAALKAAHVRQLSAAESRERLKRGQNLLGQLEQWMVDVEPTVVRDYVLSAERQSENQLRRYEMVHSVWKEKLAEVCLWKSRLRDSLVFVRSDPGAPEHFPFKLLVRDLAKIWDRYADRRFTNSRKGLKPAPEFVAAICGIIEPGIEDSLLQTAIREAVRKTPGPRRGRKSPPSDPD
jgi:hypothetical protein